MIKLGVNVDHVATVRQARGVTYPDPVEAALAAERAGADAITVHLREDRRHIQDQDLFLIRDAITIHLNQEMAPTAEMTEIALELRPQEVCLVPERREEVTTEGGLDAAGLTDRIRPLAAQLRAAGIRISLFIEPEPHQVTAAARLGADFVELHTGKYALLADADVARAPSLKHSSRLYLSGDTHAELDKLRTAIKLARSLKLKANVGHGLNYRNVGPVAALPGISWAHIGHSIVARSIMVGMARAVREMVVLLDRRVAQKR
ncbi:MAG TPA: pyridoxine 5'-phosphate synthase [Candidatus Binataceae bacterium]|nr:pyridoxine 5'-phosphate synthase [Candidatus Binataceae bacterium]